MILGLHDVDLDRPKKRRGYTKKAYQITRALKSLIPHGEYCPPGRHYGKWTKPVAKNGKRK